MKKCILLFVLIPVIAFSQSAKSKSGDLLINKLKNGNLEIENNYLRIVVSPKDSGKIVAFANKKTLEDLLIYENSTLSGVGEDVFDDIFPGNEMRPYGIKSAGFGKNEENVYVELSTPLKDIIGKDITLRKKYSLDRKSPAVFIEVELINNTPKPIKIKYGMRNFFSPGKNEAYARKILTVIDNEIDEIPFLPNSMEHGSFFAKEFMALTAKEVKSSIVMLFDDESVFYCDSFHKKESLSMDFYTKTIEIPAKKSVLLKSDIVVLDEVSAINAANINSGLISTLNADVKAGKLFITGSIYKYGKEELTDLKLKISLLDENDKEISSIVNESISSISWDNPYNLNTSSDISKINLPKVKVFYQILDSAGLPLFSSARKIVLNKQKPYSPIDKNLTIDVVFLFNPLYYEDNAKNILYLSNVIQSYSNVLSFIEKKSKIKFDVVISGLSLYNLLKNNPELIDKLNQLVSKKNVNIIATGFSYPLFTMLSKKDIENQIAYDKNLKNSLFGVKTEGVFFPELAFDDTPLEPLVKNQLTYCFISDVSILKSYGNFPDMNFYAPSRIMSSGFGLNTLIVDTKAKTIIERKSDKAINDFLSYLVEIQNKNKEGKNHLVILLDAEKWSDTTFLDKFFSSIEEYKWIKFSSAEDIFKAVIPTQIVLGEKVSGSIYFDRESMTTSFYPWLSPESKKSELINSISDTSDILTRNIEKINIAKENYKERDFSYPENLYNDANDYFMIAVNANYFKGIDNENLKTSQNLIEKSRKTVAGIYDLLISTIKNKNIKIPNWKEKATLMDEEEKVLAFNKLKTKNIQLSDRKVYPEKVSSFSFIKVDFKLPENTDYNNVYVIFNMNNSDEFYQVKADLYFNGRVRAVLGNTKSGDELDCYVYFKDKKGNTYTSDKFKIVTE